MTLLAPGAHAQEALVLSGGGSRGIAHAGALVGLERRGHDPDIVVGTSMGAVIGAFYASGYPADSVWTIMARQDWRAIFEPLPIAIGPHRSLRHPVLRLQSGPGRALVTRGYVADWRINRDLVRRLFTASARVRGDFDRLPRRFRSIAADVESGELVPLASGDLARAVRASMAAFGFFSPIRWEDRLLFDGGIADYLPVAEARRLGGEFVIAVDVLRPRRKLQDLDALSVARRSIELLLLKARVGEPDVLVVPDVDPSLSPFVYPTDTSRLLRQGAEAAIRTIEPVAKIAASREIPSAPDSLSRLVVDPSGSKLDPFLRRAFRKVAPAPFDPRQTFEAVDRLYATGLFEGVWPSVEGDEDAPALTIRAEPVGSTSLVGAPAYDNDRGGRIWSSLRRLTAASGIPVELAFEGSLDGIDQWGGLSIRVASLGPGSAWTAGGFYGESEIRFLETGVDRGDPEVIRAGGWMGMDWRRFDPDLQASLGVNAEWIESDVGPDGQSIGPWIRVGAAPLLAEAVGARSGIEAKLRFGEVGYWRARVAGSLRRSLGSFGAAALGDLTAVSKDAPLDEVPAMGEGFLMPGLRWGEHRGRLRAIAGVEVSYPALFGSALRLRLRGGALVDELESDGIAFGSDTRWLGGAGLSVSWWSFLGKLEAGVEAGTLGDRRFAVALGPDF